MKHHKHQQVAALAVDMAPVLLAASGLLNAGNVYLRDFRAGLHPELRATSAVKPGSSPRNHQRGHGANVVTCSRNRGSLRIASAPLGLRRFRWAIALLTVLFSTAPWAEAHHEAIFGLPSSLVMSAPTFVSFHTYSRRTGVAGDHTQETTSVISAGVSPLRGVPVSVALIAPISHVAAIGRDESITGLEDILLGVRYRFDLTGLQQRTGKEGNFAIAMAGLEFPTGVIDHDAFDGPMDYMFAGLGSLERGSFSGIAYAFARVHGTLGSEKAGNNLFLGAGLAWTPFDDPATERLLSFQLGATHEKYFYDTVAGVRAPSTGGWSTLVQPTAVWGPGGNVLLQGTFGIPVSQSYRDPGLEERWRVGFGLVWLIGG